MKQKKFLALALACALSLSLTAQAAETAAQEYVKNHGLMSDTAEGFAPEEASHRSDVVLALYTMEGRPAAEAPSAFADNDGYAAAWCGQSGIVQGDGSGLFSGDRTLTQAELVTLLYRYAQARDKGFVGLWAFDLAADVPEWAYEGYCWCSMNGVISQVQPDAPVTREDLAAALTAFDPLVRTAEETGLPQLWGKAAKVNTYGNVTTDITQEAVEAAGLEVGDVLYLFHGQERLELPFVTGYSDVDTGAPLARISKGVLVLAMNNGMIADACHIQEGDTLGLVMANKAGYLEEYSLRNLDSLRTNVREDYSSDEVFANFRAIEMGDIAPGRLYRSSSPVNPKLGRNTFAKDLAAAAGVKTILNLADTEEEVLAFEGFDTAEAEKVDVICLAMPMDPSNEDYTSKLKTGLEFLLEHEGPYLFHCTEGKDRTGFLAVVLEGLMGAEDEEILNDYFATYENFYHLTKEDSRGQLVVERVAIPLVQKTLGNAATLQEGAELYLTQTVGLTQQQVNDLKDKLK